VTDDRGAFHGSYSILCSFVFFLLTRVTSESERVRE